MVKTVPFDLVMNLTVGLAVAWAARARISSRPGGFEAPLLATLAFAVLVFAPIGAWLYVFHRGWSWNYLLDPARLPAWVGWLAVGGYVMACLAGFGIGVLLVRRGRARVIPVIVGLLGALLLGYLVALAERFWWVGSYADFHAAAGARAAHPGLDPLPFSSLGVGLALMGPVLLAALAFILIRFGRESARAQTPGDPTGKPERLS